MILTRCRKGAVIVTSRSFMGLRTMQDTLIGQICQEWEALYGIERTWRSARDLIERGQPLPLPGSETKRTMGTTQTVTWDFMKPHQMLGYLPSIGPQMQPSGLSGSVTGAAAGFRALDEASRRDAYVMPSDNTNSHGARLAAPREERRRKTINRRHELGTYSEAPEKDFNVQQIATATGRECYRSHQSHPHSASSTQSAPPSPAFARTDHAHVPSTTAVEAWLQGVDKSPRLTWTSSPTQSNRQILDDSSSPSSYLCTDVELGPSSSMNAGSRGCSSEDEQSIWEMDVESDLDACTISRGGTDEASVSTKDASNMRPVGEGALTSRSARSTRANWTNLLPDL